MQTASNAPRYSLGGAVAKYRAPMRPRSSIASVLQIEPLADVRAEWCPQCEDATVVVTPVAIYPPLHAHELSVCASCGWRRNECRADGERLALPWPAMGIACAVMA